MKVTIGSEIITNLFTQLKQAEDRVKAAEGSKDSAKAQRHLRLVTEALSRTLQQNKEA